MSISPVSLIVDSTLTRGQEEPDGSPGHHSSSVSSHKQPPTLLFHSDKATKATFCKMPSNNSPVSPRHVTLPLQQPIPPDAEGDGAVLQGGRALPGKVTRAP